jgi:hypothetical protein
LTDSGQLAPAFFSLLRFTASKSKWMPLVIKREPVIFANSIMRAHNILLANSLKMHDLRRLATTKPADF